MVKNWKKTIKKNRKLISAETGICYGCARKMDEIEDSKCPVCGVQMELMKLSKQQDQYSHIYMFRTHLDKGEYWACNGCKGIYLRKGDRLERIEIHDKKQ